MPGEAVPIASRGGAGQRPPPAECDEVLHRLADKGAEHLSSYARRRAHCLQEARRACHQGPERRADKNSREMIKGLAVGAAPNDLPLEQTHPASRQLAGARVAFGCPKRPEEILGALRGAGNGLEGMKRAYRPAQASPRLEDARIQGAARVNEDPPRERLAASFPAHARL